MHGVIGRCTHARKSVVEVLENMVMMGALLYNFSSKLGGSDRSISGVNGLNNLYYGSSGPTG